MGRNEMFRKRNVILKINKKQEKKNLMLERHYQNNTVRFKRPLLKIEQTFEKLEKAKHVDKLKTLIHQKVGISKDVLESYDHLLFHNINSENIDSFTSKGQFNSSSSKGHFYCEFEYTNENTNVWYTPEKTALCFNLEKHMAIMKKQRLEATTRNLREEFKESYNNYAAVSLEDKLKSDLQKNTREPCDISSDQRENIKAASSLSFLNQVKRSDLMKLIDSNQIVVIGASRDENDAFTEVPLLLLEHLLEQSGQKDSSPGDPLEPRFEPPSPLRIVCSTPHHLTVQLAVKKMRRQLKDEEYSLVEMDVGFKKKKHPNVSSPILMCTNQQLVHFLMDDLALSSLSHVILDRAHHRDDMFDLILIYMRQILLSKRPHLKLIILSSPICMDVLSNHFQIPPFKLSSNIKPSPVNYLERILQETNFSPSSNSSEHGNIKIIEKSFNKDYHEKLDKHVNLLRLKGLYRGEVINNLLNPELEGVHIGLVVSLLSKLIISATCKVILVFLPNDEAMRILHTALMGSSEFSSDSLPKVIKYHSKITRKDPSLNKHSENKAPVIILATDSIEVLDSIENVSHIVDCGCYEKEDFLAHFNIGTSEFDWITRQILADRKSWCEKRNKCSFFNTLTSVRGSHLRGLCTTYSGRTRPDYLIFLLIRLGIQNVAAFLEHLDIKPEHRSIHLSFKRLQILNILDSNERLTPVGFSLSSLHIPPHLAKMALLGCVFSCVDPVLSIIAVLLLHDPFDETAPEPISALKAKQSGGSLSDHMVWVRVLSWYENLSTESNEDSIKSQCQSSGLLYDSLVLLRRVKRYLWKQLEVAGYVRDGNYNANASCEKLVESIVYAGLYPNVAVIRSQTKIVISKLMQVSVHPSSVYQSKSDNAPKSSKPTSQKQHSPSFIAYSQCYCTDMGLPTEQIYLRDVTPVSSMAVIMFSHDFYIPTRKAFKFSLNDMAYHFLCQDAYTASFIDRLRQSMNKIIDDVIVNHTILDWASNSNEVKILRCVVQLIERKNKECSITTIERQDVKALKPKRH